MLFIIHSKENVVNFICWTDWHNILYHPVLHHRLHWFYIYITVWNMNLQWRKDWYTRVKPYQIMMKVLKDLVALILPVYHVNWIFPTTTCHIPNGHEKKKNIYIYIYIKKKTESDKKLGLGDNSLTIIIAIKFSSKTIWKVQKNFDIVFMRQKRNETTWLIWIAPHGPFIRSDHSSNCRVAWAH